MNLLAHLHLSAHHPTPVVAGNLLADYLRRVGATPVDDAFRAGLRHHRSIDAFTDSHPVVRAARGLISAPRRRLGGIIVDVAFDYVLSRAWLAHHPEPLPHFVHTRLTEVCRYLRVAGSPLAPLAGCAHRQGWLLSYGTAEGLALTFHRVASRAPAAAGLRGAEQEILAHENALTAAFAEFYPQLQAHASRTA